MGFFDFFESKKDRANRIAKENRAYMAKLQVLCRQYDQNSEKFYSRMKECYAKIAGYKAAGNTAEARRVFSQYRTAENVYNRYTKASDVAQNAIVTVELATAQAELASIVPKLLDNADVANFASNMAQADIMIQQADNAMNAGAANNFASDAEFADFYNSIPVENVSTTPAANQGLADLRTQLEQVKRG